MEKLKKITSNLNPDEVWNLSKDLEKMKEEELISLIEGCEFDIYQKPNGKYKVVDFQKANIGGIEEEEFDTILDIAIRMHDTYFVDYYGELRDDDFEYDEAYIQEQNMQQVGLV